MTIVRNNVTRIRGRTHTWWQPWFLVHSGARADPRFKELMREADQAEYWRQSGKWADFCGPVGEAGKRTSAIPGFGHERSLMQ